MKIAKMNIFVLVMAFALLSFASCSNSAELSDKVKSSFTEVQNTEIILKKVWGDGYVAFFDLAVRKADGSLFGDNAEEYDYGSLEVTTNDEAYSITGSTYTLYPSDDKKEIVIKISCDGMGESLENQNITVSIPDIVSGNEIISDIGSIEVTFPSTKNLVSFDVDETFKISELVISDHSVQVKYEGKTNKEVLLVTENGYIENTGGVTDMSQADFWVHPGKCFAFLTYEDEIPITDIKGIKIGDIECPITPVL